MILKEIKKLNEEDTPKLGGGVGLPRKSDPEEVPHTVFDYTDDEDDPEEYEEWVDDLAYLGPGWARIRGSDRNHEEWGTGIEGTVRRMKDILAGSTKYKTGQEAYSAFVKEIDKLKFQVDLFTGMFEEDEYFQRTLKNKERKWDKDSY